MSSLRHVIKDFIVTPIYETPLVFTSCIVLSKKWMVNNIDIVSNLSPSNHYYFKLVTRISLRLASMNIRTFAKSQFVCLTLLDSRVFIESNCDVITSFVTLVHLWGLSWPQPLTHGTRTNGVWGAPRNVFAQMHLMFLLWLTNYFMHMCMSTC
jgi:hypothetical protein